VLLLTFWEPGIPNFACIRVLLRRAGSLHD
jgi:hypothetical protein